MQTLSQERIPIPDKVCLLPPIPELYETCDKYALGFSGCGAMLKSMQGTSAEQELLRLAEEMLEGGDASVQKLFKLLF